MKYILILAFLLVPQAFADTLETKIHNFWKYTGAVAGLADTCRNEFHTAAFSDAIKIHDIIKREISEHEYENTVSPIIGSGIIYVYSLSKSDLETHCNYTSTISLLMENIYSDAELVLFYYQRKNL